MLLTAAPVIEGKLQAFDVACLLAAPLVLARARRYRFVGAVVLALAIWSVGQLLSDGLNGLGPRLSMQLVTAMTILAIVPVLVFLARGDSRRIRWIVVGVMAGLALEFTLVGRAPVGDLASWKFGLNGPVAIGLLALADLSWQRGRRWPSLFALGAICALGVATDDRHLAGIAVLTAMLLLFRRGRERHPRTISVAAGVTLLLAALSGAFLQAAEAGVLGERSGGQVQQFGSNPGSVLVNIRPEPFQEFYLFTTRPLLGWGSQPRLDSEAYLGSKDFLRDLGVVRDDLDNLWLPLEVPGVPAHSQAMDSWARAGLTAVPFWLLVFMLALRTGTSAIRFRSSPLAVLWTILVLWDAVFSPLTGLSHVDLAAYLALAVTSLARVQRLGVAGD